MFPFPLPFSFLIFSVWWHRSEQTMHMSEAANHNFLHQGLILGSWIPVLCILILRDPYLKNRHIDELFLRAKVSVL